MRIGEYSLQRRRARRRRMLSGALIAVVAAGAGIYALTQSNGDDEASAKAERFAAARRKIVKKRLDSNDPVKRGCALPKDQLVRIWRGYDPVHSEDVTTIPWEPNYSGSLNVTSHTGPWDYLQTVPLVFYGPEQINDAGRLDEHAELIDVYPTVGELLGAELPPRDGEVLEEALKPGTNPPRLVLVIVWDGAGRNVLDRWPDAWPTLARLERKGTSYLDASVGSSPSITPATHANLGTGAYPREHGVTAITYRLEGGVVRNIFADRNPADMVLTTFADEFDLAVGNASQVGMLAWRSWHLGMFGHGLQTTGGDADQLVLLGTEEAITGEEQWYSLPSNLTSPPDIEQYVRAVDREDGKIDGKWLGNDIREVHDNPAWVQWQRDNLLEMLEVEGYGDDQVPDLFFTNFKSTDLVGHYHTMDSKEMPEVLKEQDEALRRIIHYLDENVRDYVVVLTADHGHTGDYKKSGAFPIAQSEIIADVNRHFGLQSDESLFRTTSAAGPFLQRDVQEKHDVSEQDIATFLNGYTIEENWKEGELPPLFEDRADEPIFSAVFSGDQLPDIIECAFGSESPPPDFEA